MTELSVRLQDALGTAYRVEKELGGGGMSRVFVAEETRLGRRVVIKVLPPELAAEMSVDRFNREIQLSASLQHPHIVPLLAAGGSADVLFYTMPFVEGEALRSRLAREGELPVRDAVRILKDVADALAYAHARGIVHRDIKPDNVLLSGHHAVVADFGVAKAVSQAKTESGLTSVGVALGTPAYMAPEQAAGDPNIDHRADIYALGAMAYEMLTGRAPFAGMSPHQMLAAHITEPVVPITDRRPALSPALAALVMACLAKNPADRPQSVQEILDSLEGMATPSGSVAITSPIATFRHVLRRPRNRNVALAAAGAIVLLAGWMAFRPRPALALDRNRIAIAPFDVLGGGPELALWREGLVDVLSRSLDGAGPMRSASPTLVVRRWTGRADAGSAQALGRATGAGTVVFGGLVQAGADSVRLTATVLNVADATPLGEIELREATERMDQLVDSLTVRVLRELGRTRAIGLVRSAPLGSPSLPALKAFLQGEQFLRRSEWDSSLAYHQRAIGLDSGFTLAWSHAGMAAGWQHAANDSSRTYKLRAGAMNHGLAPRESLIVQAESLAAVVLTGPQQTAGSWWTYAKRLIATLDDAVRRYPNDPELWYMLGDARFHAGAMAGLQPSATLEAFDRAIALDSSFTPSYIHAIPLGIDYGGTEVGRRYAQAFLAAGAMGSYAQSTDLVLRLMEPTTRAKAIAYLADSADAHLVQTVWIAIGRWMDSAETVVAMVRARVDAEATTGKKSNASVFMLPSALAARGHVKDAAPRSTFPALLTQYAMAGAIPRDSATRLARSWVDRPGDGILFAVPLLAAARDTVGILNAIRKVEGVRQRPPPNLPPIAKDFFGYALVAQRAYLALARGDSAEALRLFDASPDTAAFGANVIDDLVHAQLLAARGRPADAAALLERPPVGFNPGVSVIEILRALERGRVNERLGNRERAIAGYAFVVKAWRNPDPELQPFVDESRAALTRLSAEKASSAASQ